MRQGFLDLMARGGPVMWPLLGLSVLAVALAFERCWFWLATNNPARLGRVRRMGRLLRTGDAGEAKRLAATDRSVYGLAVRTLTEGGAVEAAAVEAIESQRPRIERFMPTLSTIITAAPMLGILGTVLGIISSFNILAGEAAVTDPKDVSLGIAEALITTAAGLVIAILVLLPYNAYRAQVDRTLGRMEGLAAAASRREPVLELVPGPPTSE